MADQIAIINSVTGTGSSADFTSSGFGTPTAALFLVSSATAADTDTTHASFSYCLWDAGATIGVTSTAEDAQNRSDTWRANAASSVGLTIGGGGSFDWVGTISTITDGVRITYSDTPGSSWRLTVVLLKDVDADVCSLQMSGSVNGTATYSGCPFTPQAGLVFGTVNTSTDAAANDSANCVGMFTYVDSTITQRAVGVYSEDNNADGTILTQARNDRVYLTGQGAQQAEVTAVTSSGFTVTTRTTGVADWLFCLLLGNLAGVKLLDTALPTSTGDKNWTGAGFQPQTLLKIQTPLPAYNTAYSTEHHNFAIGITDGATAGGIALWDQDGAPTTVCKSRANTSAFVASCQTTPATTERFACTFSSFGADGWTENWAVTGSGVTSGIGFTLAIQFSVAIAPRAKPRARYIWQTAARHRPDGF